ncbi:hypothetical protein ACSFBM_21135 [Variovorax sp. GB1R11]|uniref:hypothetical protein n=1 Tax=Variovorax sp. GB1R11 TaxID=3443741 RepID=UPI003F458B2E
MKALPPDLLATLQQPVLHDADLDTQATFFEREEVQSFYFDTLENPDKDDVLRASAGLLPGLHPHRAALLALLCGALVENGADPRLLFDAAQGLMGRLLASLAPYCAMAPQEAEADEAQDEEELEELEALAAWQAANAAFEALAPQERFEVGARQAAVDLLVLPLMAMVVRDVHNYRALLADGVLMSHIEDMYANDALPFEQLHFLRGAAQLAYEDELVVLLPTSRVGMVVKAHGINNNFHAFSLLQDLMRTHAATLGIRQSFAERPAADDEDDSRDSDAAEYLWLQATAFSNGELVDGMAWSWGEGTLRENARRQGKLVLVAVETEDKPARSWNGFNGVLHSEQKAHVSLVRFLAPDEVAAYLA